MKPQPAAATAIADSDVTSYSVAPTMGKAKPSPDFPEVIECGPSG